MPGRIAREDLPTLKCCAHRLRCGDLEGPQRHDITISEGHGVSSCIRDEKPGFRVQSKLIARKKAHDQPINFFL